MNNIKMYSTLFFSNQEVLKLDYAINLFVGKKIKKKRIGIFW